VRFFGTTVTFICLSLHSMAFGYSINRLGPKGILMRRLAFCSLFSAVTVLLASPWQQVALAATVINETITPAAVNGVVLRGDGTWLSPAPVTADPTTGAPGWGSSSFISNITGGVNSNYSEFQVNLDALFGRTLTINDLQSISYNSKNNAGSAQDWDIRLYTDPQPGDIHFYHSRFEANPPVTSGWQTWSTDSNLKISNVHSGTNNSDTPLNATLTDLHANYGTEKILYLSFIAGASGNTLPIANNLDGISIKLSDGSVANINLAAVPEPASVFMIGLGVAGLLFVVKRRRGSV
jgi:hypothetical protein